jgi:hypothetical protein
MESNEMKNLLINEDLLYKFEEGLVPHDPEASVIKAKVLGFGEISSIFQVGETSDIAFKRMPLFREKQSAEDYNRKYHAYCALLEKAGLTLPRHQTAVVEIPRRSVVLYIAQEQFAKERFVHNILHTGKPEELKPLIEQVIKEIQKVWEFNRTNKPELELSLDGQLSNWVKTDNKLYYIDTSTPIYRELGKEQLDPEPLLKSAPSFLRWILKLFFVKDVMNRYYDQRLVYTDLAANLYKERRHDLIPMVLGIINRYLPGNAPPLTIKEIDRYYREDKLIWALFLAFRRTDRWISTKIFRKRYEFILPGKIKR